MTRIFGTHRNRFAEVLVIGALTFVLAVICGFGRPGFAVSAPAHMEASTAH